MEPIKLKQFTIDYHKKTLISSKDAIVNINPEYIQGCKIVDRSFTKNIENLYSEDYVIENIVKKEPPYVGASYENLPNITVIPNLKGISGKLIMGCTMGHYQESLDGSPIQVLEVYEYNSYGAMLIDKQDEMMMELYILKPGDKVYTLNKCNMTLYNLDFTPLITSDFANPKIHQGDKTLQSEIGPSLIMVYDGIRLEIKLNPKYVNRLDGHGVNIPDYKEKDRTIHITTKLGEDAYNQLLSEKNREKFEQIGVRVIEGESEPYLAGEQLKGALIDIVEKSRILQNYFKM